MSTETIHIKRYPNRRFYSKNTSKYVTLDEIEAMICRGDDVEIRDSQTGEELTRAILTQIIIERHPEKMALFPSAMLHYILRANEMTANLLKAYFQQTLSQIERMQSPTAPAEQSLQWMQSWWDNLMPHPPLPPTAEAEPAPAPPVASPPLAETEALAQRLTELEQRLQQLESGGVNVAR
jgi:polyhydroxyalkanoate synthesis repressor PhaR